MVLACIAGSVRLPVRGTTVERVDSHIASGLDLLQLYLTLNVFSQKEEMTIFYVVCLLENNACL